MSKDNIIIDKKNIPDGTCQLVKLGFVELGIYNINGRYYALVNRCSHQGGPICEGRVSGMVDANHKTGWKFKWSNEGEVVYCPWHGLGFNILTGECISSKEHKLKTHPLIIKKDKIIVELSK